MNNKRVSPVKLLLSVFFVVFCVFGLVLTNFLFGLPTKVESALGSPSPDLSKWQTFQLSFQLMLTQEELFTPADSKAGERPFSIVLGEATSSVITRLQDDHLINNSEPLRIYLIYKGYDTRLQAGDYLLSPAMSPIQIAEALLDATPEMVMFNILAGWRLEEIAAALPTSGFNITPEDFLAAAYSPTGGYEILANLPKGASVEGFMLPGSYQLDRDLSANELIHTILENYRGIISGDLQQSIHRQGLNLFQAITLASIVEREAIVQEEQPIIASVFLNRLAIAMKLEADPTVQYALGYNPTQGTWWTNPLSAANLIFDSPYNTYLYPNLPPGPISNPSFSALQAVAFAADTPYYFFRAACDGSGRHTFAETYIEHQNNGCVN